MKNNQPYISLKVIKPDGKVISVAGRKSRRIYYFVKANDFQDCTIKVSVRYSPGVYNKGTYSDGIYNTKEYLAFVLQAFLEP